MFKNMGPLQILGAQLIHDVFSKQKERNGCHEIVR